MEKDFYSEEEDLTWEEDAAEKFVYVDGELRAMSGGSEPHAFILVNMPLSTEPKDRMEPRVELFERGENDHWDYTTIVGLNSMIAVLSLGVTLALSQVYD